MEFTHTEDTVYSQLQKDVLQTKLKGTYMDIKRIFNFAANQQIENFLLRTILGFRLDTIECDSGAIPLVSDTCTEEFKALCLERATELNCIYTHKAISLLEQIIADRAIRGYELAQQIHCPFLAGKVIKRISEITLSPQWFHYYCNNIGIKLLNPQSLEELRRKYCHTNVITQFYIMLNATIHQIPHLLYNMDETAISSNHKGRLVVPDGHFPLCSEERCIGHTTIIYCCNAAGEAIKPFIILPLLQNLPNELNEFTPQCEIATSPSGWVTSKLFFSWTVFFADEIKRRREILRWIYGPQIDNIPCFLLLDGHKSRLNSMAIELLYSNNIRVIVLPAHTSHVTQPFDVAIAAPFKTALRNSKDSIPQWMQIKLQGLNPTAQQRYMNIVAILDSWKKSATIKNIKSGFEKAGIYPFNMQRVIGNKFVRQSIPGDVVVDNHRNSIQINGIEITTFQKRLEIAKHFYNNQNLITPMQLPDPQQIVLYMRNGKEKLLGFNYPVMLKINNADLVLNI